MRFTVSRILWIRKDKVLPVIFITDNDFYYIVQMPFFPVRFPALLLLLPFTLAGPRRFCLSSLVNQVSLAFTYTFWFAVRQQSKITWRSIVTVCDCSTDCTIFISNCLHFLQNCRFQRKTSPKSRVLFELDARVKPHRHGSSTTFETKSCYYRVAQQPLPCCTAVARFGFKRRATVAVKSN